MKKFLKLILSIAFAIYMVVALGLTVCLLSYNEYNITEIGNMSLIIIRDDELNPDFKKGDLVVVTKNSNNNIKIGDKVFFYNAYMNQVDVNLGKVVDKEKVNEKETTFILDDKLKISSEYIIGKTETSQVYNGVGSVLGFLESKWGFLITILLPLLLMFVYVVYEIALEIKKAK